MKLINRIFILVIVVFASSCSYFPDDFNRKEIEQYDETLKYIKIGDSQKRGLIMYPGGLVDPASYVKMLVNLEIENLTIFIAKVPYNLSILDIDLGAQIRKAHPLIQNWSLMGHSLGGSVACFELDKNLDVYDHLILLAAYPGESTDLKDFGGIVVSLAGSEDLVLDDENYRNSLSSFSNASFITDIQSIELEENTSYFYEILGGNHAQFGDYGAQKGDGDATISRLEQQAFVKSILQKIL